MHAAQVASWADGPRYAETAEPAAPSADEVQLTIVAAGAHSVVRARAAGRHYSAQTLPHTPGVDAVGRDPATGALHYVMGFGDRFGTLAERVNVPRPGSRPGQGGGGGGVLVVPLPAAVADPRAFAASVNPAMSGWMALQARAPARPPAWTCLVLGATSASGRLAVHAARALGASRVVGAARGAAALAAVSGLDATVVLGANDPAAAAAELAAVGADVVLDYVYGDVAEQLFAALAAAPKKPVQYVQIGTLSGRADVALPAALLRSADLTIRGAGPGSWSMAQLSKELPALVEAMASWPALETTAVPLKDIETAWDDKALKGRVVYVP